MFEEVAANDAAMSEIRTVVAIKFASHPVATVKIGLTVVKVASLLHIGAIMPCKLPALNNAPDYPRCSISIYRDYFRPRSRTNTAAAILASANATAAAATSSASTAPSGQ